MIVIVRLYLFLFVLFTIVGVVFFPSQWLAWSASLGLIRCGVLLLGAVALGAFLLNGLFMLAQKFSFYNHRAMDKLQAIDMAKTQVKSEPLQAVTTTKSESKVSRPHAVHESMIQSSDSPNETAVIAIAAKVHLPDCLPSDALIQKTSAVEDEKKAEPQSCDDSNDLKVADYLLDQVPLEHQKTSAMQVDFLRCAIQKAKEQALMALLDRVKTVQDGGDQRFYSGDKQYLLYHSILFSPIEELLKGFYFHDDSGVQLHQVKLVNDCLGLNLVNPAVEVLTVMRLRAQANPDDIKDTLHQNFLDLEDTDIPAMFHAAQKQPLCWEQRMVLLDIGRSCLMECDYDKACAMIEGTMLGCIHGFDQGGCLDHYVHKSKIIFGPDENILMLPQAHLSAKMRTLFEKETRALHILSNDPGFFEHRPQLAISLGDTPKKIDFPMDENDLFNNEEFKKHSGIYNAQIIAPVKVDSAPSTTQQTMRVLARVVMSWDPRDSGLMTTIPTLNDDQEKLRFALLLKSMNLSDKAAFDALLASYRPSVCHV